MTTLPRRAAPIVLLFVLAGVAGARQTGSIRGVVYDADFDVPLAAATVMNVETGQTATTTAEGAYRIAEVPPGTYTLVFSKEGYVRRVEPGVVVRPGELTDVDVRLASEFTEMEEFVVQDLLPLAAGSEAVLLQLRLESPALLDSIGADQMSKAGASDAAAALKLVAGATVKDGKSAVIRGLPDRYVSSQINSVRLPSADEDRRAVELDQFPSAVIESIQVSKTFTPDQQGDASGGAVNVRLRGIPDETMLQIKAQLGVHSQVGFGGDGFLSYDGGGLDSWGEADGRGLQSENLGGSWDGAVGATEHEAPIDYKWSIDAGTKHDLGDGVKVGGFASLFYERESTSIEDGRDDSLWIVNPGDALTPQYTQGTPDQGEFKTALFDLTRGTESVRLGGLGTLGIESEDHALDLTYLLTRSADDVATRAVDTRGKEFFFPGHDPDDPSTPGNAELDAAPYIRTDTLEFTERTTGTLQLSGHHTLPPEGHDLGSVLRFRRPELDWTVARSSADLDQPDKRQFSAIWQPFLGGLWSPYKPAASFRLGNLQRTFKEIEEESDQYALDLKLPFEQWSGQEGYLQTGLFDDRVERTYDQESFSNFDDNSSFQGGFDDAWSEIFDDEDHPITDGPPFTDVDYDGEQDIRAWYAMADVPLCAPLSLLFGARLESTEIRTANEAEEDALWLNPDSITNAPEDLDPGEADVSFEQDDLLPAVALTYQPHPAVTLRGAYSETVARQTFKELTPILQQEFVGGPVFVGNPDLEMSNLDNYDLRLDYAPSEGSLFSLSWFKKDIENPIEYVQRVFTFTFTQPRNYPSGTLDGYEVEARQDLGRFAEGLEGLSLGANATFIDSEVVLPDDEAAIFADHGVPITSREATNAPEYLYNLYLTWDLDGGDTQIGLFYSVQGDTLLAGAGALGNTTLFVPSVYQEEFGTLNLSVSRRLGRHFRLQLQAKNLTDPDIETVYRSDFVSDEATKSSYSLGREFTFGLSFNL